MHKSRRFFLISRLSFTSFSLSRRFSYPLRRWNRWQTFGFVMLMFHGRRESSGPSLPPTHSLFARRREFPLVSSPSSRNVPCECLMRLCMNLSKTHTLATRTLTWREPSLLTFIAHLRRYSLKDTSAYPFILTLYIARYIHSL